jgi:hypothetical protein
MDVESFDSSVCEPPDLVLQKSIFTRSRLYFYDPHKQTAIVSLNGWSDNRDGVFTTRYELNI